jgi:hypothetical protein
MTKPQPRWRSAIAVGTSLLLLAVGCGGGNTKHAAAGAIVANSPPQLKSIQELRSAFNSASREPTLVLLVAPT